MNTAFRLLCALACALPLCASSFAQSGAVIPQGGAGHAPQASCVILKRMGPADQVTSHLYSFGIRGKQFQYIEGKLPEGFPFHGRLTDHDVRNMQGRGAEVIVLNQNYTSDELRQARADCRGETGTTPNQSEPKQPSAQEANSAFATPASSAVPVSAGKDGQLQITSTPAGADIEIDGSFVGSTPSTVGAVSGQHQLTIKKSGFKTWERKITVSSGQISVNATLDADH